MSASASASSSSAPPPSSSPDTEDVTFEQLGVCPELCQACEALGWSRPTKIQKETLPWAFKERDIIGLAETGSGKTGAFALPVLQSLLETPSRLFAVVLAPTRELCVQIAEQFQALGASISLEVAVLVGGLDIVTQAMALAKKPHVIVASPGRLVDHLEHTKGFSLRTCKFLVMDEADRLLSMDFEEALNKILEVLPRERRTFLFSATMTSKVGKLQRASLHKPVKIEVSSKYDTASGLVQNYMLIPHKYKHTYLAALLHHFRNSSAMVFCNTCLGAQKAALMLRGLGFASVCLHGRMSQTQRLGALSGFKAASKKVLVATEVGSRGLDIPHVDLVVNFDVPLSSKDYIHRVGRTARAGRAGRAVTLVTQYDVVELQRVEFALGRKLDEFSEVSEEKAMGMHERCAESMRAAELELREKEEESGKRGKKRHVVGTGRVTNKKKLKRAGVLKE